MALTIQFLRGDKNTNDQYTGKVGQITVDQTDYSLRIHDGTTAGGHTIPTKTVINQMITTAIEGEDTAIDAELAKKLDKTVTSEATDLNTLVTEGQFYATSVNTNLPDGVTGAVFINVQQAGTQIRQELHATVDGENVVFERYSADGSQFGAWNQIGTKADTITGITGRLDTAEGEIDQLQTDMTQAKSDIDAAEAAIEQIKTDYVPVAQKGVADGVATLDADGKIPSTQLPALAITNTHSVADIAARDKLVTDGLVQEGDVAIVANNGNSVPESFIYTGTEWKALSAPGLVQSVAGKTGVVTLEKADVGLANVENYAIASDVEAKTLTTATVNTAYMTPLRTKNMLEAIGFTFAADGSATLDLGTLTIE